MSLFKKSKVAKYFAESNYAMSKQDNEVGVELFDLHTCMDAYMYM